MLPDYGIDWTNRQERYTRRVRRGNPRRQCLSEYGLPKIRHATRREAEVHAAELGPHPFGGSPAEAYTCPHCGLWHVGRPPASAASRRITAMVAFRDTLTAGGLHVAECRRCDAVSPTFRRPATRAQWKAYHECEDPTT